MNQINTVWLFLEGKKSYLVSLAFAVFNILNQYNVINVNNRTVVVVNAILAAAGVTSLRLAIRSLES